MGEKIVRMYVEAEKMGALAAKMKLAMLTRTSSIEAVAKADTPENLAIFEEALKQLREEYAR